MTQVAVYEPRDSLAQAESAWALSQRIANTDFVPKALRDKPEAVMASVLMGYELGIGPMQSLAKIHVIEGRPGMAAELMRAVVLARGHELDFEETSNTRVTMSARRSGSSKVTKVTWTLDDAKTANLTAKDNWRKYPRAMLIARCTGEICRMVFADVIAGISYTLEELTDGDIVDPLDLEAAGAVSPSPATGAAPAPRARRKAPRGAITPKDATPAVEAAAAEPKGEEAPPALPGEPEYEGPDEHVETVTDGGPVIAWHQSAAIRTEKAGMSDDHRHGIYAAITGGRTNRGAELDRGEQNRAMAAIVKLERKTMALATFRPDGQWALIEADAGVVDSSAPLGDVTELEIVYPPEHAGIWPVPVAEAASPSATIPAPTAAAATEPDAAESPTEAESEDSAPPADEAGWRGYLRGRRIGVVDAIKTATELVGAEAAPRNLEELVADVELAGKVFALLEAS